MSEALDALGRILGNDDAFPCSQTIRLNDNGVFCVVENLIRLRRCCTLRKFRGWNSVRFEKLLCETLAGFEPRLICSRTDYGKADLPEGVNNTFAQWNLGPDERQIGTFSSRELCESVHIIGTDRDQFRLLPNAAVAGGGIDFANLRTLG